MEIFKKKNKKHLSKEVSEPTFSTPPLMIAKPKHCKACIAGHYHGFIAWRFYPRTGPGNVEPLADNNFRFATLQCIQGIPRKGPGTIYEGKKWRRSIHANLDVLLCAAWIPSKPTKYSPKWGWKMVSCHNRIRKKKSPKQNYIQVPWNPDGFIQKHCIWRVVYKKNIRTLPNPKNTHRKKQMAQMDQHVGNLFHEFREKKLQTSTEWTP